MLRRPHVAPFIREAGSTLEVEFLRDTDGRVVAFLERMLRLTRRHEGRPRAVVSEALRRQERRVRDARRLAGIARTLLGLSEFRPPEGARLASHLRDLVFTARGRLWPPLPGDHEAPYAAAAAALNQAVGIGAWETGALALTDFEPDALEAILQEAGCFPMSATTAERLLYADAPEARVLVRAPALDGAALLARYNLDLARGVLLDAESVTVTTRGHWRAIFRAVKLARLMHRIERAGRSWRVHLTGPAAAFVTRPERYGIRFARVVPALVAAPGWRLDATIVRGPRRMEYHLDAASGLSAPARRRRRFDSMFERSLARDFAARLREERQGWTLVREDAPVAAGGEVFLPDFTLRHRDGREALVEIVGYWTPEYLAAKLAKVRAAGLDNLILVVYRGLAAGVAEAGGLDETGAAVIWFAATPRIGPVLEAAERVARRPGARRGRRSRP
jgi:hypothetical protein